MNQANEPTAEANVPTETIIKALYILADDIQSDDGVAQSAIRQAARRMQAQEAENARIMERIVYAMEHGNAALNGVQDKQNAIHHIMASLSSISSSLGEGQKV